MFAYVTKAGPGPEPEFALLCRSFFRFGGSGLYVSALPELAILSVVV